MPKMSPEVYRMLSDIFRLILREVKTDDDKEKLAPGELGISYEEGTFYIRDPYTGELFSPNSLEHIKQILEKYDPNTNLLNADRISGLRFYTSLTQIRHPGGSAMTVDTIIREMDNPSIAIIAVDDDNYDVLNYPTRKGIIEIKKLSDVLVTVSFLDIETYTEYRGKYNPFKHLFEGWVKNGGGSSEYTESGGTSDQITAAISTEIKDLSIITLRLTTDVNPGATLSVNESYPDVIVTKDGKPLSVTIGANNIIILIRNELKSQWILMDSTESTTEATLNIMNTRMSEMAKTITDQRSEYIKLIQLVRDRIDTEPGNIITNSSVYTAEISGITDIPVQDFVYNIDKLVVNYNQTILRPDIDYTISADNSIKLRTFKLTIGDTLQFIVLKQKKL